MDRNPGQQQRGRVQVAQIVQPGVGQRLGSGRERFAVLADQRRNHPRLQPLRQGWVLLMPSVRDARSGMNVGKPGPWRCELIVTHGCRDFVGFFLPSSASAGPLLTVGLFMPDDVVMATKTLIVDDLDGSGGDSTVSFSLGNTAYEIDLSKKNKAAMERSCPSSLPPPAGPAAAGGAKAPAARAGSKLAPSENGPRPAGARSPSAGASRKASSTPTTPPATSRGPGCWQE